MTNLIATMTKVEEIDNRDLPLIRSADKGDPAGPDTPIDDENEEMGLTAFLFDDEAAAKIALGAMGQLDWDNAWAVLSRTPEGMVIVNLIRYGAGSLDMPLTLHDLRRDTSAPIEVDRKAIRLEVPDEVSWLPVYDID